uniref:Serine carboxypeptidase-like 45 n=1 Tax=Cicer arietinum TaxID=3827 RepID=A0A1S2Z401_CICAR|nr:serine carboxypeptidase-like 45 [Cicer arietinum]
MESITGGSMVPLNQPTMVWLRMPTVGTKIGNPLLEFNTDYNSRWQFLWSHGLKSYSTYELLTKVCNCSQIKRGYRRGTPSSTCVEVNKRLNMEVGSYIDQFDISHDACLPPLQHTWTPLQEENKRAFCLEDKIFAYLNKKEVQKALHTRQNYFLYNGDQDFVIPFIGTQSLLDELAKEFRFNVSEPFKPWYNGIKVAGFTHVYGGSLSFATIRGAGQYAAASQPEQTLVLFKAFLEERPLPKIQM